MGAARKGVASISTQLNDLKNATLAAAGLTGLGTIAAQAIASADAMSTLKSRLDLVTGSADRTAAVQARLFDIAQGSRVGFTELGSTYAQIARSSSELGITQDRLLTVTQALSQAMTIGGGSASSQGAALVQLSQGLAAGTLRGEELNSILEQTPRVAQAIADGMGVSVGQLRKLGEQGSLTARAVIEALEKAAPQLAAEFEKIKPTISGAFVTVKNAAIDFVGELDRATGSSEKLAGGLTGLAQSITEAKGGLSEFVETAKPLAELALWAAGGVALARALQAIASVGVGAGALALLGRMGGFLGGPLGAAAAIGGAVVGAATADDSTQRTLQVQIDAALRRNGGRETGEVSFLRKQLESAGGPRADSFGLPALPEYSESTAPDIEFFDRGLSAATRAATQFRTAQESLTRAQRAQAERDKARQDARGVVSDLERAGADPSEIQGVNAALAQRLTNIDERYKPEGLKEALADRKQALAAALADERAAVEFGSKLQLGIIDSLGKQGVLSDEQVVRQRLAVQQKSIDGQLLVAEAAREAAGTDASEKAKATGQINALVRERLQVEQQATNELSELAAKRVAAIDIETQAFRRARYDDIAAVRESIRLTQDENQARLRSIATGLDEAEMLRELKIARLEAELAVDERPDPEKLERIALLREELRLLQERRQIEGVKDERRAADDTANKLVDEARAREADLTKSLTDALYRGFENGKTLAENFRDTLKSTIGTLVLRPLIEPIVKPIANAASGFIESLVGTGLRALMGGVGDLVLDPGGTPVLAGDSPLASTGADIRGRRALGGPVDPYSTYVVGEEGPELLRMGKQAGSITPNPATIARMVGYGGGTAPVIHQHFDFSNSVGIAETVQMAAQMGARMGSQQALSTIESANRRNDPTYTG